MQVHAESTVIVEEEGDAFNYQQRYLLAAGDYHFYLELYGFPLRAGSSAYFELVPALNGSPYSEIEIVAVPVNGNPGSSYPIAVDPIEEGSNWSQGKIALSTVGDWELNFTVSGEGGIANGYLPLTATSPPIIPTWAAWTVGLSPALLLGTLVIWWSRRRT